MLVNEPEEEEDEALADAEREQDPVSLETEQILKNIDYGSETEKAAGEEGTDEEESSSDSEIDETDRWRKVMSDIKNQEKQKKRKRSGDDNDDLYIPSLEHVQEVQTPPSEDRKKSNARKHFPQVLENIGLEEIGDFSFVNDELVKKLEKKVEDVLADKKKLEKPDQADIDILKVRIAELEEEKARRDEQNEYFKLKNKELEANNIKKEHEMYMMNKVLENLIGKPVEQIFEEIEVEEVRARRKAAIEAKMKNKGKGVPIEGAVEVSEREIVVSEPIIDPEKSILNDDDDGNDDDDQGSTGIKVTEASTEENVDDYLYDDANEEPENAGSEEEHSDAEKADESDDHCSRLILRLEHNVEEGEYLHTYNLVEIIKLTHVDENEFKVEVEDCSNEEQSDVNVDTSNFPTLAEFFSQANEDELQRKVAKSIKNKSFDEMSKEERRKERKNWFKKDIERKFKRPLKFYKKDIEVSLGDIISWGYLPQVNAYAIRREYGVQYFAYIQDIMYLPWWDVEELPKVRTLTYPIRERDMPTWGLMKFEAFKDFKDWKPHYPKKVKQVDPVTGIEETILKIKKPRVIKNIPLPKMEQGFYEGFLCWVYSCMSTEAVITYRVENEVRYIHLYDPMWIVNCSAKDIECLFVNKIGYKAEDKDQALQFQKVATICFQKGINSENAWMSKWRKIEKEEALKAEKGRKEREGLRGKWMKMQAEEKLKATKENEKLKSLLKRKPKQREEKFKSL
ncbi:myb-like protein X [Helianthus annuus]|uniref:myb-like protein X n=1 Tax=Helianthus annuus TaxID=4232 RepID=UPI000B8FF56D|nr:myb-like protein X [Helianthus annuus]